MNDKSKEQSASIRLINDKLHFAGSAGDNDLISIDYISPLGDNMGYTSLELLLLSLSSCLGSVLLTLLRRMNKNIEEFDIQANGIRNEEHPTGFSLITLNIKVVSHDITEEDMEKVIPLAEDKYCPVWSMIKGNTAVEILNTTEKPVK